MARTYTLKKRALQQDETRQRIADAALELHSTLGPAQTTFSMIAEKAGVQRHTLYAHFPDEQQLFAACSGLAEQRDPFPVGEALHGINDSEMRLKAGLEGLYDWFGRNETLVAAILRDAEYHDVTRETVERTAGKAMKQLAGVLGEGLNGHQRALLQLSLSFHTWRTLVRQSGLTRDAAIAAMTSAVFAK